jgi:hypothetical protein
MVVYGGVQVGLIVFLYFVLTNPLYLVLLVAGGAAVYYFQQVTTAALVDCLLVDRAAAW